MNLKNSLFSKQQSNIQSQPPSKVYARVIDVVLDESHRDYELFGKVEAIGGIRYKLLNSSPEEDSVEGLPFAYPSTIGIRPFPLKEEIVEIYTGTGYSLTSNEYSTKTYYKPSLNIWNNPNHNGLPEINTGKTEADLGFDPIERSDLPLLNPFPGDIIIESRLGSTLRFSGYKHPKNIYTDKDNNGKPFTILTNTYQTEADPLHTITEDVNSNDASIYLTSDHKVPLTQNRTLNESYSLSGNTVPISPSVFKGAQILLNSDRIVVNAKKDNVLISSQNYTSLSGKHIHLDAEDVISQSSSKMYLEGKDNLELTTNKWKVKVDDLLKIIEDLTQEVVNLTSARSTFTTGTGPTGPATNSGKLQSILSNLRSKKR